MTPNSSTAVTTRRNSCADLENAQRHPLLKSGATARSRRACGAGQSRAHGPIICATCRRTVRSASPGAPHAQGRTKLSPGGPSYVRNWLHLRNRKGVSLCHLQGSKFKFLPMLLLALNWKSTDIPWPLRFAGALLISCTTSLRLIRGKRNTKNLAYSIQSVKITHFPQSSASVKTMCRGGTVGYGAMAYAGRQKIASHHTKRHEGRRRVAKGAEAPTNLPCL